MLDRVRRDAPARRINGAWIAAAAALVIAVSSAVLMLEDHRGLTPSRPASVPAVPAALADRPGFSEGRAAFGLDGGLSDATICVVARDVPLGLMAGN